MKLSAQQKKVLQNMRAWERDGEIVRLRKQNAELLAALKGLIESPGHMEALGSARALIAKIEAAS